MGKILHYIIIAIELIALSAFGALISALSLKIKRIFIGRNLISATLYSILMPSCLCSGLSLILTIEKPFLRAYTTILMPLLSPQIILFSFYLLGTKYAVLRIILSITIASSIAFILQSVILKNETIIFPCEINNKNFWHMVTNLFKVTIKPTFIAIVISIILQELISVYSLGKMLLFPKFKTIALVLSGITKLCAGQDVIILNSIKGLPINFGFFLAFSIMGSGFCLSMIPFYKKILSAKGTVILFFSLLGISLIISLF